MAFIGALGIGFWARSRRARPVVGAVGAMLIPLGLYLLGVTGLVMQGIKAAIDWVIQTQWTDVMTWGIGLLGGGVILCVIAAFLPKDPKEQQSPTPAPAPAVPGKPARPAVASPSAPAAAPTPGAKPSKGGLTAEDQEIEELLKKRGIM